MNVYIPQNKMPGYELRNLQGNFRQLDLAGKRRMLDISTVYFFLIGPHKLANMPGWKNKSLFQRVGVLLSGGFWLARFRLYGAMHNDNRQ